MQAGAYDQLAVPAMIMTFAPHLRLHFRLHNELRCQSQFGVSSRSVFFLACHELRLYHPQLDLADDAKSWERARVCVIC